jgi:hypothetical protein
MPPYFPYIYALMAYIAIACAVWFVAVVLAFPRRTRKFAKRIAAGMAGSFPGVFLFQLLSAPLAVVVLLLFGEIFSVFKPAGGWEDICFIGLFLGTVGLVAVMSLLGFYTGWRVAWELAAGRSARAFLVTDRVLGPVVRFLRKRLPFLERVL